MTILGVDPGTRKVGFAVVDERGEAHDIGIEADRRLCRAGSRAQGALGIRGDRRRHGHQRAALATDLAGLGVPVTYVDERETTLRARSLYFADHPPRGWRRLIPLGMQLPPRPDRRLCSGPDRAPVPCGRRQPWGQRLTETFPHLGRY